MPYRAGFDGIYWRTGQWPRYGTSCSSTVTHLPTVNICDRALFQRSYTSRISANLSTRSRCSRSAALSKRMQLWINVNRCLDIVARKIGRYLSLHSSSTLSPYVRYAPASSKSPIYACSVSISILSHSGWYFRMPNKLVMRRMVSSIGFRNTKKTDRISFASPNASIRGSIELEGRDKKLYVKSGRI